MSQPHTLSLAVLAVSVSTLLGSSASASDQCASVLAYGVFDEAREITKTNWEKISSHYSYRDVYSDLYTSYGWGSYSSTEEDQESSNEKFEEERFLYHKTASDAILNAWKSCILSSANVGIVPKLKFGEDPSHFQLSFEYFPINANPDLTVQVSWNYLPANSVECQYEQSPVQSLQIGFTGGNLNCERKINVHKEISLVFNSPGYKLAKTGVFIQAIAMGNLARPSRLTEISPDGSTRIAGELIASDIPNGQEGGKWRATFNSTTTKNGKQQSSSSEDLNIIFVSGKSIGYEPWGSQGFLYKGSCISVAGCPRCEGNGVKGSNYRFTMEFACTRTYED